MAQFGITINEDGSITSEFFIALENLVSDCCKVHGPGLAKLEAFLNKAIRQAGCYAHLRRYFLQALEALNLKEVFNAACKGSVEGFEQRVDYELAARGIKAGKPGRLVLTACFMIEVIFWLEADFEFVDRAVLEERRKKYTSIYVNRLYAIVEQLKSMTRSLKQNGERNNVPQYSDGKDVAWGKAIVYALNNTVELHAFLENGNIECSNNRVERALRHAKCHMKMMQFIYSSSGFSGLADLMTLYVTCKMNNVNPYQYFHWAFANAKLRLEDYRFETSPEKETAAQICWLPRARKGKDGKTVGLYDPEFKTCFDNIKWTGLDVWSYKSCLDAERPRIKEEFRARR